ncbi:hypothetical protein L6R53_00575 [Myxococcota bacterium]|nr:hypothetical protein [Myxococcota bacterium]
MDRRVVGVGLAGLLVGALAGALAVLEGSGPVDHTEMFQPLPQPEGRVARPVEGATPPTTPARDDRPDSPERLARRDRSGADRSRAEGPPAEDDAEATDRPRGAPYPMPPEPDTGMPPPGVMLGLPEAEVDDATLIGELAAEPFPLPERPLSDVELEALEDRAAWVSEACAAAPSEGCGQAQANVEAALSTARKVRSEADLPDPDLDPDDEAPPVAGPPPKGPPPGAPPPGGAPAPPR